MAIVNYYDLIISNELVTTSDWRDYINQMEWVIPTQKSKEEMRSTNLTLEEKQQLVKFLAMAQDLLQSRAENEQIVKLINKIKDQINQETTNIGY